MLDIVTIKIHLLKESKNIFFLSLFTLGQEFLNWVQGPKSSEKNAIKKLYSKKLILLFSKDLVN